MPRTLAVGLTLLALLILPFGDGGESVVALTVFTLFVATLLTAHLVLRALDPDAAPVPWRKLRTALIIFGLISAWLLIQLLPQPLGAHPLWQRASEITGGTLTRHITLDLNGTVVSFLFWISAGAVFAMGYLTSRRRDVAMAALWGVIGVCAVYALLALMSYATNGSLFGWGLDRGIIAGPFASKNSFATFLGLGLICAIGLGGALLSDAATAPAWKRIGLRQILMRLDTPFWLCVVGALLLLATLLFAQSRGATLAIGATLIAMLGMMVWARMVSGRAVALMGLGFGVPLVLAAVLSSFGVIGRFDRLGLYDFGRGDVYISTLNAISDAWIMGTGAGAFLQTFPMYRFSTWGLVNTWEYAHNGYLELLLGLGVPMGLALLGLIGWAVLQLVRSLWLRRARLFAIIGISASALLALHAITDYSLQIAGVTMLYAFLLGVCVAQTGVGNRVQR